MLSNPGRRQERYALLKSISSLLSRDDRVAAAWLFGSLGRGTADDFSDIDIWIVVEDDQIDAVAAARQAFAAQIETPPLVIEMRRAEEAARSRRLTGRAAFSKWTGTGNPDRAAVPATARILYKRKLIPRIAPAVPRTKLNLRLDASQFDTPRKRSISCGRCC